MIMLDEKGQTIWKVEEQKKQVIYKAGLHRTGGALLRLKKLIIIALEYLSEFHEQIDGWVIEAGFDLTESTGGDINTEQVQLCDNINGA